MQQLLTCTLWPGALGELDKRLWPKNYDRVELIPLSPADASAASYETQRIYESIAVKNPHFLSGPLLREKNHLKMLYVKEQAGILQWITPRQDF